MLGNFEIGREGYMGDEGIIIMVRIMKMMKRRMKVIRKIEKMDGKGVSEE